MKTLFGLPFMETEQIDWTIPAGGRWPVEYHGKIVYEKDSGGLFYFGAGGHYYSSVSLSVWDDNRTVLNVRDITGAILAGQKVCLEGEKSDCDKKDAPELPRSMLTVPREKTDLGVLLALKREGYSADEIVKLKEGGLI